MRSRLRASLTAVLALLLCRAPAAQRDSTPLPVLLGRAAEYVNEFERQMTNVVADERYVQQLVEVQMRAPSGLGNGGDPTPVDTPRQRRELRSDFLVVRLGPNGLPVPFRDVYEVDGRPVRDRADRLTTLFLRPTDDTIAQAWRVVDEGARYNIGEIRRTVNVPVLPVVVLRAANQERFRFVDRGESIEDGARVRVVEYAEQRRPTIIRGHGERDLPARGRLWVVPATGRVVKGELNTADGWVRTTLVVRYGFDRGVNATVPIEMRDTYLLSQALRVIGVASYSGFRRFTVDVNDSVTTDRLRPVVDPRTEMELMQIPAGTFGMGSPDTEWGRHGDEVRHEVTLSRPFLLGRTEVTQEQWQRGVGTNPSHVSSCGPRCPVENVTFAEVEEFLARLTRHSNSYTYRLPTEAEWEFACRAGTTTPFATGENLTSSQANYDGTMPYATFAPGVFRRTTTPEASFAPNAWGLLDMHGNVAEWTSDWYGPNAGGSAVDPQGPPSGEKRVVRGGSWLADASSARCALRDAHAPAERGIGLGFRVAADRRR